MKNLIGNQLNPHSPLVEQLYGYRYHFAENPAPVDHWLADEILGMWEWQKRAADRVLHETVEIQALAIGDWRLVSFPGELFSALGRQVVDNPSSGSVWAVSLANGFHGYLPVAAAFAAGGYECCLAYQSRLEPAAGEKLVAAAQHLLTRLAG